MNVQDKERIEMASDFARLAFTATGHLMMSVMAWIQDEPSLIVIPIIRNSRDKDAAEELVLQTIEAGAKSVAVIQQVWVTTKTKDGSANPVRDEAVLVTYSCLRAEVVKMAKIRRGPVGEPSLDDWTELGSGSGRFCNFFRKVQARHAQEN